MAQQGLNFTTGNTFSGGGIVQTGLFEFNRDLDKFAKTVGLALETVVRKVAIDLFGRIVARTPVDTGRARASWVMSIGSRDEGPGKRAAKSPMDYIQYQTGPAISPPAGALAGDQAARFLSQYRANTPGDMRPIWITNNLPYIGVLERGHSKQAPNGMVALAIAETEAEIDAITKAAIAEAEQGKKK